jgi:hypothetical protein
MFHGHRADFIPKDDGKFRHFNHTDSNAWNDLWLCFLPAQFDPDTTAKTKNAYLHVKVNGSEVFKGEIKTGTRSARRTATQDPEKDLYIVGNNDKKIRILGHWGSRVMFKDVAIKSVGST